MGKQPSLNNMVKRRITGPRHDYVSLPGFWFKPKKYSTEGAEEIRVIQYKIGKAARNPTVVKYARQIQKEGIENPSMKDLMDRLGDDELGDLLEAMESFEPGADVDLLRLKLMHGIGDNNFRNNGKLLALDEAVPILMQDAEAIIETLDIIEGWNIPLPAEPSERSVTPPGGSTEKSNSK